jgi:hypothetical protein
MSTASEVDFQALRKKISHTGWRRWFAKLARYADCPLPAPVARPVEVDPLVTAIRMRLSLPLTSPAVLVRANRVVTVAGRQTFGRHRPEPPPGEFLRDFFSRREPCDSSSSACHRPRLPRTPTVDPFLAPDEPVRERSRQSLVGRSTQGRECNPAPARRAR